MFFGVERGYMKTTLAKIVFSSEAMKKGSLAGILWHQGEADSGDPAMVTSYADRFAVMIGQLRKDLDAGEVPVLLGELIHGYGNHDAMNVAFAAAAKKVPHSVLVSSEGLGKGLHFDAASARQLGQRYAAEYLKMMKQKE